MTFPYSFTPHARLSANPLFAGSVRKLTWGASAKQLVSYSQVCLLAVCGAVLSLWFLLVFFDATNDLITAYSLLLVGLSFLAALALDYTSMAAALNSISGEIAAKHWDLLRLTSLTDEQIVLARQGVAQSRTWRLMVFVVTLRVATSLSLLLTFLLLLDRARPLNLFAAIDLVLLAFGYGWIALFMDAVYIVEPYWRMSAITALAVAISARTQHPLASLGAGIAALLVFWLAQGIVTLLLVGGFFSSLSQLLQFDQPANQLSACVPLVFIALALWGIYAFYAVLQSWSLRRATGWVAALN